MDAVKATVQFVDLHGRRGPYALAVSKQVKGSITFSLDGDTWQSHIVPQNGMFVILSDLFKKEQGWRAESARPYTPADEAEELQKI